MRIRAFALTAAIALPGLATALFVGSSIADRTVEATTTPVAEPLPDMPEGVYKIDSVHSAALFRVKHMGAGNFWGRFNDVNGQVTYTPSDDKKTFEFNVDIPIDGVDSGNDKLDQHLKSPDFFNGKEHKSMTFKSTEIERISQDVWDVSGKLTMNGVTKDIVALVRFISTADLGRGYRAGFEATFDIKRSDFNMNYGVESGTLGDMTHVVVAMEVVHDDS